MGKASLALRPSPVPLVRRGGQHFPPTKSCLSPDLPAAPEWDTEDGAQEGQQPADGWLGSWSTKSDAAETLVPAPPAHPLRARARRWL